MKHKRTTTVFLIFSCLFALAFGQESAPELHPAKVTLIPEDRQLPLRDSTGYTLSLASVNALFLTKEAGYDSGLQAYSGLAIKTTLGLTFGLSAEAAFGQMLPSPFTPSLFRYRGFSSMSISAGPFLDLSRISGLPGNLQVGIAGGAAFGYYRESRALFFFPVMEPGCTFNAASRKPALTFAGSVAFPVYFRQQALSYGLGIKLSLLFSPSRKKPYKEPTP